MTSAWSLARRARAAMSPDFAGRRATDAFSNTRAFGLQPADVLPLGAHAFPVSGNADVTRGYLWGEGSRRALLVHGWGADSTSMQPLVAPLRELGYSVAAFDAPGHGIWPGNHATMSQYAASTEAVLDSLGGVEVVVAHSLGSIAAVAAVAARPADVRCMALLAPTCTLGGILERWRPADLQLTPGLIERIRAELHRRNGVPVTHWDIAALGASLTVPVLALHDPQDDIVPYREAQAVVEGVPDARLIALPGSSHMGILMVPEAKAIVSQWVAEHAWLGPDRRPLGAGAVTSGGPG